MKYEITAPDGRRFEVTAPEGATEDQVLAYAKSQFSKVEPYKPVSPTDDMSGMERFRAGMGKGMVDVARGIGQRLNLVSEEEVAEARKNDEALMNTGAGVVGNVAGSLTALAPALMVPGANSVAGAAVVGGLSGLTRPTVQGESVLKNVATDAALGGVSQFGVGKLAEKFAQRLAGLKDIAAATQAKNAVKDAAVADAKEMGLKTVPSISGGNALGRTVEGLTGTAKAKQMAAVENQPVIDGIIRKTMGLADDAPISKETMRGVRAEAAARGYDPVRQFQTIVTDDIFHQKIGALTSRSDNAAKDFGALVDSDVKPLVDGLRQVKAFSGDTAVDAAAIFREKASDLYAQGNKTLATAYRKAADAVEDQIERGLERGGKDGASMMKEFRAARVKMAQSFDIEKAIREGEGTIDARVLGKIFGKDPGRLSGDLGRLGRAASAMPDVMQPPKAGWANHFTALDTNVGALGSIFAGNPLPLAIPATRAGARMGLMSGPGQRMMTTPSYGPGMSGTVPPMLLEALKRYRGGAAVPSIYAAQE